MKKKPFMRIDNGAAFEIDETENLNDQRVITGLDRGRFEEWAASQWHPCLKDDDGEYIMLATRDAWRAWQAAIAGRAPETNVPHRAPQGWTFVADFRAWKPDENDLHAPWYVIVPTACVHAGDSVLDPESIAYQPSAKVGDPSGPALSISFNADDALDKSMAEWIAAACNAYSRAPETDDQRAAAAPGRPGFVRFESEADAVAAIAFVTSDQRAALEAVSLLTRLAEEWRAPGAMFGNTMTLVEAWHAARSAAGEQS